MAVPFSGNGQQLFLGGLTETLSSEVFDDHVHVSLVDRTESHAQGLLVNYRNGYRHVVGLVEIGNDATREIRVGIAVVVHELVDEVKRFELVVGIVILSSVVEMEVPHGNLSVILILEVLDSPVSFRLFPEDGVPAVYLIFGVDTVTVGDVAVHVLDQLYLFGMEVETPFHGRSVYLVPFVLRQEPVFMTETPEHDLVFPVALEHGPLIVLQELPELGFVTESDAVTLIKVFRVRICLSVKIKAAVGFRREFAVKRSGSE